MKELKGSELYVMIYSILTTYEYCLSQGNTSEANKLSVALTLGIMSLEYITDKKYDYVSNDDYYGLVNKNDNTDFLIKCSR